MRRSHRPENLGQLSNALLTHVAEFVKYFVPDVKNPRAIGASPAIPGGWGGLSDRMLAEVGRYIEARDGLTLRALPGTYVAAICPKCGGWTMMHGEPSSSTAREWTRMAYVLGDLIVEWRNPISVGPACPGDGLLDERTCDQ